MMECDDAKCPTHGALSVRGKTMEGVVVSDKMRHTVVVEKMYHKYINKYDRSEKRTTKVAAHNPPCIHAVVGDKVQIRECRPLSKTKHFVVIAKGD